jgi:hypothetical protein
MDMNLRPSGIEGLGDMSRHRKSLRRPPRVNKLAVLIEVREASESLPNWIEVYSSLIAGPSSHARGCCGGEIRSGQIP